VDRRSTEARRDAGLVRSAREQLAREIADNQRDTEVYDLQDLVDRAQERYRQLLAEASGEFFLATQRPAAFDAGNANLQLARSQGLTLVGAFETYRMLMAQLVTQYEAASKL
jgi:hypothetical protein